MADEKGEAREAAANPAEKQPGEKETASRARRLSTRGIMVLAATAAVYAATVFASWGVAEKVVVPRLSTWLVVKEAMRLAEEASAQERPPFGEIYIIEDLVVNPAGSGGMRYLCVSVGLESKSLDVIEEITTRDTQIKDALIEVFSSKTMEELADIHGRDNIRREIKERVEQILPDQGLDAVYFVNFVLQ